MTIEESIFTALTAGSPTPLRAYPDILPDLPVFPLITYIIVGGQEEIHLGGHGGLAQRLVQVDAWGRTRLGVAQEIETAKQMMLAATDFSVGRIDVPGAPTYEPDSGLYRASLEFSIHYNT